MTTDSPRATIRYTVDHRTAQPSECEITAEDSIEVVRLVMRRVRELNGKGALVLWVEFQTEGTTRRYYTNARSRPPWPRRAAEK